MSSMAWVLKREEALMGVKFEYRFSNVNEEEIKLFEKRYNVTLPPDYKQFLLENNGGKPEVRRFETKDGKMTSSLMILFPLSEDAQPNLISVYNEFNQKGIIPPNFLAIGDDPIENKICISISGNNFGAVYYWSLDMEDVHEDNYIPTETNFSIVAESFTDFMNSLFVSSN